MSQMSLFDCDYTRFAGVMPAVRAAMRRAAGARVSAAPGLKARGQGQRHAARKPAGILPHYKSSAAPLQVRAAICRFFAARRAFPAAACINRALPS